MSSLPLDGIRIIAVEQYGAGPYGSQLLADIGAEVIKIREPNDGLRCLPLCFAVFNRRHRE